MKEAPQMVAAGVHRDIAFLSEALPAIQRILEDERAAIVAKMEQLWSKNELTGEASLQLWAQYRASIALERAFTGRIKMGRLQLTLLEKTGKIN